MCDPSLKVARRNTWPPNDSTKTSIIPHSKVTTVLNPSSPFPKPKGAQHTPLPPPPYLTNRNPDIALPEQQPHPATQPVVPEISQCSQGVKQPQPKPSPAGHPRDRNLISLRKLETTTCIHLQPLGHAQHDRCQAVGRQAGSRAAC